MRRRDALIGAAGTLLSARSMADVARQGIGAAGPCFQQPGGSPCGGLSPKASILSSLIGYWKLDEASGTRADSGPNSLTLTDNGGTLSTAGKISNAANFVRASNRFLSSTSSTLKIAPAAFSFSAWVHPTALAATQGFAANYHSSDRGAWRLEYDDFTRQAVFALGNATTSTVASVGSTNSSVPANTTVWLWCGYDPTVGSFGTIYLSVNNGTLRSSASTALPGDVATAGFTIGAMGINTWNCLDGWVDEALFAGAVHTAAERTYLYNSGNGRTYPF